VSLLHRRARTRRLRRVAVVCLGMLCATAAWATLGPVTPCGDRGPQREIEMSVLDAFEAPQQTLPERP